MAFNIKDVLRNIRYQSRKCTKVDLLVMFCVALVILRSVFPRIMFDELSFRLIVLAAVLVTLPFVQRIIERTRLFRVGSVEFQLDEALESIRDAEEELDKQSAPNGFECRLVQKLKDAEHPHDALVRLRMELTNRIEEHEQQSGISSTNVYSFLYKVGGTEAGINSLVHAFGKFNAAVRRLLRDDALEWNDPNFREALEIGIRLCRLFDSIREGSRWQEEHQ